MARVRTGLGEASWVWGLATTGVSVDHCLGWRNGSGGSVRMLVGLVQIKCIRWLQEHLKV